MISSKPSETQKPLPNWMVREKARNLQRRKEPEPPSEEWRSFGKAVEFNTKRMLIVLRYAQRPTTAVPAGWRNCCWQCVEHFRQVRRRMDKRWQTRYYIESRKFRERLQIRTDQMERFLLRSYSEASRMAKYMAGNPLSRVPDCKTWSMAGKRAYERINHEPIHKDKKDAWEEAFRRKNLSISQSAQDSSRSFIY